MKPRKRRSLKVDGTWDIECWGWVHPVVIVTRSVTQGVAVHYDMRSAVCRMLDIGGTWWSHNGGKYDTLAALEELRQLGVSMSVSLSGSSVTRAQGGGLCLCDSYQVIPLGLERAAELAGRACTPLGWPCSCGSSCGGYCGITSRMPPERMRQLADYCVEDTGVLLDALGALCDFAERHDYDLRGTIGGSAWATAQRWLNLPDADLPAATWKRCRSGYYGGRVSVLRPCADHGRHWDISSAYPAALACTPLPVGEVNEYGAREATRMMAAGRPGIYACTMHVPEMHAPPLPWWTRAGTCYPVGDVSGTWALPEIHAAEARGCKVTSVAWCVVWEREELVFSDIMKTWTDVRFSVGKESAWGAWMRLFPNSITGKLAEQPNRRFVRLHPPLREIRMCPHVSPCTLSRCVCDAYQQVDNWGEMWSVPYYRQGKSSHVQWAAYTTAATRGALLSGLEAQGMDAVYCDTDSIWTTGRHHPDPVGDGLGEWALKGTWADWRCAAPKSYSFIDGSTGELTVRAAGARLHAREWLEGEAAQDRGALTFLDAARQSKGLFASKRHRWTLPSGGKETGWYGDRRLDAHVNVTHPVTCEELQDHAKARRQADRP